jgi:DNA-binding GntR family transcriptional regulator
LNHHQKDVLHLFLKTPSPERLSIDSHRAGYKISYATVRADLLSLEESGYLSVHAQRQAFIFTSGQRLSELIES